MLTNFGVISSSQVYEDEGGAPVNTTPPVISGTSPYYVNSVLNGTNGVYDDYDTLTRTYQISLDNGATWSDTETAASHTVTVGDQGTTLQPKARIKEVATKGIYSTTTYSNEINLFNPKTSITSANLLAWTDYTDTLRGTVQHVANAVHTVTDKAGNSMDLTQLTGAQQPLANTAPLLNGFPVVRYDGSNDRMTYPSALNTVPNGNHTSAYFIRPTSAPQSSTRRVMHSVNASNTRMAISFENAGTELRVQNHSTTSTSSPYTMTTNPIFMTLRRNGTNVRGRVGGVLVTDDNNGANVSITGNITVGANASTGAQNLAADFAEQLTYDAALSAADENLLGGYGLSKYGIPYTPI